MCDVIALHEGYRTGDLGALKRLLGDPPDFPNCRGPVGVGEIILQYAIYHSPLAFIRPLLELGADPNYRDHAGFPALIAALSTVRADRDQLIELLLASGADIQQRGINDWTPLHYAAANDDVKAIELLLAHGADPSARTRIDDCATPLERRRSGSRWSRVGVAAADVGLSGRRPCDVVMELSGQLLLLPAQRPHPRAHRRRLAHRPRRARRAHPHRGRPIHPARPPGHGIVFDRAVLAAHAVNA